MAALRSITFEESLCKALRGLNLEIVSLRVEQKEAISKQDTLIILSTGFAPADPIPPHRPFLLPVQDFIVRKLTNETNSIFYVSRALRFLVRWPRRLRETMGSGNENGWFSVQCVYDLSL